MQKLIIYPNNILRAKTSEIEEIDNQLIKDTSLLIKMLSEGENAAGLAAPQIGISKRFFGVKDAKKNIVKLYVNPLMVKYYGDLVFPKLINKGKEEDFLEGCLSFPDYFGTVKRYLEIEASWKEIKEGNLVLRRKVLNGFDAIVFQHELDHLNGVLFVDRVKENQGKFYKSIGQKMEPVDVDEALIISSI